MSTTNEATHATSDEYFTKTDELPWARFPGVEGESGFKLLRVNRDIGGVTALLRIPPGSYGPMHKHTGAGEYLIVKGHIPFGDKVLGPGDYFFEPAGLTHSEPPPDEEVIMLVVMYGPIATKTPDGAPGPMVDADLLTKLWERELAKAPQPA
jgi:hypothetical protein